MEGMRILRSTERNDLGRCESKHHWRWREGLVPKYASQVALLFGQWVHEALANWYTGPGPKRGADPVKTFVNAANRDKDLLSEYDEEQWTELHDMGELMLTAYMEHYGDEPDTLVIRPEETVAYQIQLLPPVEYRVYVYSATFDLVFRDARTGLLWLREHKTAASIRTDHLELDLQAGPYPSIATEALHVKGLIPDSESIAGIEYNFLRKTKPDDRPRDDEGYVLNKDGSRSKRQPPAMFLRYPLKKTSRQQERAIHHIRKDATRIELLRQGSLRRRKTPHWSCARFCDFFRMCTLEESGGDWKQFKQDQFTALDPYADNRKSTDELLSFEF